MAAWITGGEPRGAGRGLLHEIVSDFVVDDDALGRHADLSLMHEGAKHGGIYRRVDVGVVEHDERRLAAELEQCWFQMPTCKLTDAATNHGRTGEVDAPHRGMCDQRFD